MSRVRSDIPIYALTRHEMTRRRVTLYRGVYPVPFDVLHVAGGLAHDALAILRKDGAVNAGDLVIFTKGEFEGVSGGTNTMQILTVPGGS
jgi:pyruvate kinase